MSNMNKVVGICLGIIFALIGCIIITMDTPILGRHGHGYSTFHWVGWLLFIYGIYVIAIILHGLLTDRKKHRAAIERCKAARQREAEAAKDENTE